MVKLLRWTGKVEDLGSEKDISMERYQELVGGYFEAIVLKTGERAYVNEDASYSNLPLNPLCFLHHIYTQGRDIHPRGNVIVFSDKEWRQMT